MGNKETISLSDGRSAPTNIVRALAEYDEKVWPGALVPEARAAIIHLVLTEARKDEVPVLRTNYPFCLDDEEAIREKASPCMKRAGHRGDHQDNSDGTWR